MQDWLRMACEPAIVRRALKYALVVGAVLIAINHGDALLRGDLDAVRLFRIGLTVVVPYCVSTASSVEASRLLRQSNGSTANEGETDEEAGRRHAEG